MKSVRIFILILILFGVWILLVGCGSGGGNSGSTATSSTPTTTQTIVTSGNNVQTITVDGGPSSISQYPQPNVAFTSVTVCEHGSTSNCATIDHVMVDTGSSGLRLLSSALAGSSLSLQTETANDGNQIGECVQFSDLSYVWGSIQIADVYLANGNEIAYSVPIHVLDSTFSVIPQDCSSGYTLEDDLNSLGANGILGIGSTQYDCSVGGTNFCAPGNGSEPPTAAYYECSTSGCTSAFVSLAQQVQNPVALFSTDNNGVIIELPAVSDPTQSLTGSMVFGIGTQTNNALGSTTKFSLDQNGYINTTFNGTAFSSYIDSGSNAYFFQDKSIAQDSNGWYIPGSTLTLPAIIGSDTNVSFSVDNADNMLYDYPTSTYAVLNTLAGYLDGYFDWGLPFFYGRNIYTSITAQGNGTYFAF
jgi:hypothetical protein